MKFKETICPNCHKPYYEIFAVHTCDGNVPVCTDCALESVFNTYHSVLNHLNENMLNIRKLYERIEQNEGTQNLYNTEEQAKDIQT